MTKVQCSVASLVIAIAGQASAQVLHGFASLPAETFRPGVTSGQFRGNPPTPWIDQQPVQGISGMIRNLDGTYTLLSDNGFGGRNNSMDYVLVMYNVTFDPRRAAPGGGVTGSGGVIINSVTELSDPNDLVDFEIQAEMPLYRRGTGVNTLIPTAPAIRDGRLLTGRDFDPESFRPAPDGSFWIGDEFGPLLLNVDAQGRVLRAPVKLEGVASPQDPYGRPANLQGSGGYEGLSFSHSNPRILYAMLERPIAEDLAAGRNRLQINTFDAVTGAYTGERRFYPLSVAEGGTNIGDFAPLTDDIHLVIERDGASGANARFKRVFLVDFNRVDEEGNLRKFLLVDLLDIADPFDLNQDGLTTFTFPFVTIEGIQVLDDFTIAITNDNNFPGTGGRGPGIRDNNEFIEIRFPNPIASFIPPPCPADFDATGGAPDGSDLEAFLLAFSAGNRDADVNRSGGAPDGDDLDFFFTTWLAGGC